MRSLFCTHLEIASTQEYVSFQGLHFSKSIVTSSDYSDPAREIQVSHCKQLYVLLNSGAGSYELLSTPSSQYWFLILGCMRRIPEVIIGDLNNDKPINVLEMYCHVLCIDISCTSCQDCNT